MRQRFLAVNNVCVCIISGKGDVTISMSDDDFTDLATGKLNAQKV